MEENDKIVAAITARLAKRYDEAAKQAWAYGRLALNRAIMTEDTYYTLFSIPPSTHPDVAKIISDKARLIASEMAATILAQQVDAALPVATPVEHDWCEEERQVTRAIVGDFCGAAQRKEG